MAASNRIPILYKNRCYLCDGPLENLEHCLIECPLLTETRNQYAEKLRILQCTITSNQDKVKFILGNKKGLKHNPEKIDELCNCIEFVDKMIVNRAILIQNKLTIFTEKISEMEEMRLYHSAELSCVLKWCIEPSNFVCWRASAILMFCFSLGSFWWSGDFSSSEIKSNTCLDLLEVCKYFIEFKCFSSLGDVFFQSDDCKKFIISNENMYMKTGVTYKRFINSKTFNDLVLFMISNNISYAKNIIKSVHRYYKLSLSRPGLYPMGTHFSSKSKALKVCWRVSAILMFCFSLGSFWWSGDFSSSGIIFYNLWCESYNRAGNALGMGDPLPDKRVLRLYHSAELSCVLNWCIEPSDSVPILLTEFAILMFCFSLGSFWWSGDFSSSGEIFNNCNILLYDDREISDYHYKLNINNNNNNDFL
ncbi:hypothetical protein NAPIS_ORF02692 [Vairimorpha apis BRL 01]|uniref:Uncharacterized protein n=1 Tax=Vairimorpha apis BRL 01 TaxID=1037528 RepID=T0MF89_9MICR|nr:hypothetical protein NAPIS_ORF02692 [Vairimorpha apis BRL 01]